MKFLSNKSVACFDGNLLVTLSDSHDTCYSHVSRSNNRNIWFVLGNIDRRHACNQMKNKYLF